MKNTSYIFFLLLLLSSSCSSDLESLNVDTKNATSASGESFFAGAVKNMGDLISQNFTGPTSDQPVGVALYLAQQFTNATHTSEPRYFYDGNTDWSSIYEKVLRNLYESERAIRATTPVGDAQVVAQNNQLAIIEVLNVYMYTVLVEIFGNVPYSEALNIDNVTPKYDDAETIYIDLISRMNAAIGSLDPSGASFGQFDLIYNGRVERWQKFANSLKLRMGLRIIEALPELGTKTAQEAIASGVIGNNQENALFRFLASPPNNNSLWVVLVQNLRPFYIAAQPLVDKMNTLNDPRRPVYFSTVNGAFIGGKIGVVLSYNSYSHMGAMFHQPDLPCIFLDYSTVSFMLAEAAERGIGGTPADAKGYYDAAVTASMEYYGVAGQAEAYLTQPAVNYLTAPGNWKEKIGTQKWLALYLQGLEAWTEYRRLGYPELAVPEEAFVNEIPSRLVYPRTEHTLNPAHYEEAASAMGGDLLTHKLFWDVN